MTQEGYLSKCQQMQLISDGAVFPTGSDRIHRLRKYENLEDAVQLDKFYNPSAINSIEVNGVILELAFII
ncbi:hypothetical protein [uncultured Nostoc sp.]|uniref:hypothetical protein n=2 Tax=Nostoc TaxID=1177 RepID=UPI0035CC5B20